MARHQAAQQAGAGSPAMQTAAVTDQAIGGEPVATPKYRIASGNSSAGRDRGDRL